MENRKEHLKECLLMFEKLSDYIDRDLDETLCREMEAHAEECIACRVCLKTLRRTVELCRGMKPVPIPEGVSHRIQARLQTITSALTIRS